MVRKFDRELKLEAIRTAVSLGRKIDGESCHRVQA